MPILAKQNANKRNRTLKVFLNKKKKNANNKSVWGRTKAGTLFGGRRRKRKTKRRRKSRRRRHTRKRRR